MELDWNDTGEIGLEVRVLMALCRGMCGNASSTLQRCSAKVFCNASARYI